VDHDRLSHVLLDRGKVVVRLDRLEHVEGAERLGQRLERLSLDTST
jgi:hypothetical protein